MRFLSRVRRLAKHPCNISAKLCVLCYQGTASVFKEHLRYLKNENYTPILLSQLIVAVQKHEALPDKSVLITFDKGGRDLYTRIYPLLKQYNVKANIFLAASLVTKEGYLTLSDIDGMDSNLVEFGLHSYSYCSYSLLSPWEIENDIICNKALLAAMGVSFQPAIAFPNGNYPRRNRIRKELFFLSLEANNILLGFCMSNKANILPLVNPLLIKRLEIRPDMPLEEFAKITASSMES